MLFLSLCVNTRCLAKHNNTYWRLGTECEHPQLKLNVSQLTITKTHLFLPVYIHMTHFLAEIRANLVSFSAMFADDNV